MLPLCIQLWKSSFSLDARQCLAHHISIVLAVILRDVLVSPWFCFIIALSNPNLLLTKPRDLRTRLLLSLAVHHYAIVCCFQSLDGHHGAITCVKFDDYHIITGSLDCYAMAWSAIGNHKKCLQAFRHPKYVTDVFCSCKHTMIRPKCKNAKNPFWYFAI